MAERKKIKGMSEAKLFQKYSGAGRASDVVIPEADQLILPSSIIAMNWVMNGGIPYGRIVEFLGEPSGGKTLLAMDFARSAQDAGGMVIWVDAERSMTEAWAEENGLDLDDMVIFNDNAVETISDFLGEAVLLYRKEYDNNEPILIVIDSTAALDSLASLNSSQEDAKAEMGNRAKALYKLLRIRNKLFADLGICTILVNQLRDTIQTGFQIGPKTDTSPGGKAAAYYSAIRLGLYHKKQYKNSKKHRVGADVRVEVKKNKVGPPRAAIEARVVFDPAHWEDVGFQPYHGLADLVQELGILDKQGNAFYLDGEKIASGRDDLHEVIEEDDDIRADIIRAADIYTMKAFQNRLEEIDHNIFPVEL